MKHITKNYDQWFKDSLPWLKEKLKRAKSFGDIYIDNNQMQIFKNTTLLNCPQPPNTKITKQWFSPTIRKELKYEHTLAILNAGVFSIRLDSYIEDQRTMNGYLNQKGKLPSRNSFMKFVYLGSGNHKRWFTEWYFLKKEVFEDGTVIYLPTMLLLSECTIITDKKLWKGELK